MQPEPAELMHTHPQQPSAQSEDPSTGTGRSNSWLNSPGVGVFHLLGSVTSVTGVTFLWLKEVADVALEDLAALAVAVSFVLGLITLSMLHLIRLKKRWVQPGDAAMSTAYYLVGVPVALALTLFLLLLINKIGLSFSFGWFFQ